ncbi:MAG: hypothetical protein ABID61_02745 [Candidatus Micrarchaeota archaeon]
MTEGLLPLAKNRPKELQVVDFAFDIVAERLGIKHRRVGMFAWPNQKLAQSTGDGLIIQVTANQDSLVFHQAWLDLAWGITGTIFGRIPSHLQKQFRQYTTEELFRQMSDLFVYEGKVSAVLFELAELYWKTAIHLSLYDDSAKQVMDFEVAKHQQTRFQGLLITLPHEVAIGTEPIPITKLKIID